MSPCSHFTKPPIIRIREQAMKGSRPQGRGLFAAFLDTRLLGGASEVEKLTEQFRPFILLKMKKCYLSFIKKHVIRQAYRHLFVLFLGMTGFIMLHAQTDNTELQGSGTAEYPYLIQDEFDLRILQQKIDKNYEYSKGKYYRLTADIHLNKNVLNEDGTLTADTARLTKWIPIGKGESTQSSHAFMGNFDGNGHTIYGIYINDSTSSDQGLFGFIHEGGVVRRLTIADSYILGTGAVGGIAGQCDSGEIVDCENQSTIMGVGPTFQVGGIVGHTSDTDCRLLRCVNSGHVTGHSIAADEYGVKYNCDTGGVCGSVGGAKVDSCQNNGVVLSMDWGSIGGVAGSVHGGAQVRWCVHKGYVSSMVRADIGGVVGNNWQTVTGCRNEGQIVATTKGSSIGGIVGKGSFDSRIYNSENYIDFVITIDSVFVGGIVGNMTGQNDYYGHYTPGASGCKNYAHIEVTSQNSLAGGICAFLSHAFVNNSENHGHIASEGITGGIVPKGGVDGCINTGLIEGNDATGGIVGDGSAENSYNFGLVRNKRGKSYVGGIVGLGYALGCANRGEVCSGSYVGGVVGYNNFITSECYNAGFVHKGTDGGAIAGVCGGNGSVENCYNAGTVSFSGNNCIISGVTETAKLSNWDTRTISNCYNIGDIYISGENNKAGSVIGQDWNVGRVLNCYYLSGKLHGSGFTNSDSEFSRLTPLAEEDFRTLTDKLNMKEWEDDPDPFVQGYYRPVLQCTTNLASKHYFEVTTYERDTVFIDLGAPMDNTIFKTEMQGLVLDAYNVLSKDTIRNAMLIDEKDFRLPEAVHAQHLTYTRRNSAEWGAACLPFDISIDDMPVGCTLLNPLQIKDDGWVLTDMQNNIQAGHPFIFTMPEGTKDWKIEKQNIRIAPEPVATALMKGVFCANNVWDGACYLPTEEKGRFLLALPTDSIMTFRACLHTPEPTYSSLLLSDATGVSNATEANKYTMFYNLSGHRIPAPKKGLNIIRMSDRTTKKVMVK